MKKTTYKKDSWHYRINTSENMLIPMINQKYGSVDGYWGGKYRLKILVHTGLILYYIIYYKFP